MDYFRLEQIVQELKKFSKEKNTELNNIRNLDRTQFTAEYISSCDGLGQYWAFLKTIISEPAGLVLATLYRKTIFRMVYC